MNKVKNLKPMKDRFKLKPTNLNIDAEKLSSKPEAAVKNSNSKGWKKNSNGWLEKETSYH